MWDEDWDKFEDEGLPFFCLLLGSSYVCSTLLLVYILAHIS